MNNNESLVARRQAAVARGVSMAHPVFIERAENALLWDADGRRYIDGSSGAGRTTDLGGASSWSTTTSTQLS